MTLFEEPFFTFRFADDRIMPRFHREGVGRRIAVFEIEPVTDEWLGLIASATAGKSAVWTRPSLSW